MRKTFVVKLLLGLLVLTLLPACGSKSRPGPAGPSMAGPQQPSVFVQGEVRNRVVPWSEGLRLSQALDAAEYTGRQNPMKIYLLRQGRSVTIYPSELLSGKNDPVLEAGDAIQIIR